MRLKQFLLVFFALIALLPLAGCGGSGGAGLNGSISLETGIEGSVVTATATYTNPDGSKNLIGTPITFYVQFDGVKYTLGTLNTNSSGSVKVGFPMPGFNGTKDIIISAKSGELEDFKSISMTGRTIVLTPPAAVTLTAVAGSAATQAFAIAGTPGFVKVTDPFADETLVGHVLNITYTVSSSTGSPVTLNAPLTTTVQADGTAPFPGATGTITIPATAGTEIVTINWTAKDPITDLTASGSTTVTLTASAPVVVGP
ncbi:hypothetical protein [Geomonas propionica]|uniref:Uncharacterized protein n=1 Tax=Geomonas propionica TaxID=2798582 RepID=A0ABS0YV91_9BACT|nr:hypothetical protein [Geomonas propionica]MBJ6801886.1 hypothetical protein [Geomonas propionica]